MTIDKQYITFSTGRRVFLSRGSVGLAASNTDERWLFDGSSFTVDFGGAAGVPADVLEPEEAIELADYMIALWHRFRTYSDQRIIRTPVRTRFPIRRPAA